jgi:hypothetical protein
MAGRDMTKRSSNKLKARDFSYRLTDWLAGYKAASKGAQQSVAQ